MGNFYLGIFYWHLQAYPALDKKQKREIAYTRWYTVLSETGKYQLSSLGLTNQYLYISRIY